MLFLQQLQKIFPSTKQSILLTYVLPLQQTFDKFGMVNVKRKAAFLSQIGYESQYFQRIEENLNYSYSGLLATFPKYFTPQTAIDYARQPEKIANRVYANRHGNGSEASGDGYRYRGRGTIQLTFKDNYQAYAKYLNKSLEDTISYLTTPDGAVDVGGWYWNKLNLNLYADLEDVATITKKIQGGYSGLTEREKIYKDSKNYLN